MCGPALPRGSGTFLTRHVQGGARAPAVPSHTAAPRGPTFPPFRLGKAMSIQPSRKHNCCD